MFRRSSRDDVSKLTKQQKEVLKQFMKATGNTEKLAFATLKDTNWDLHTALLRCQTPEMGGATSASSQADQLSKMYLRYKDPDSDMILADGISQLCDDLDVPPEDISLLVFSWHCNASAMCKFSKEEFLSGLRSVRATSIEKLKNALPQLRAEVDYEGKCREIYNFAFGWAKEEGQKWLALDTAVALWQLILGHRKWPLLDPWCEFVQERYKKSVSKDTWTQLFEFTRVPMSSLSHYDEEAAWPTLIDDFVTYLQEKGTVPAVKVPA